MNKISFLNDMATIANELDDMNLYKDAEYIDGVMMKIAQDDSGDPNDYHVQAMNILNDKSLAVTTKALAQRIKMYIDGLSNEAKSNAMAILVNNYRKYSDHMFGDYKTMMHTINDFHIG